MTRELELPELPEPYVIEDVTELAGTRVVDSVNLYTADQMRAYALATLANTQEGENESTYDLREFFKVQMDILCDDFRKYANGDPRMPFSVVRESVIAVINAYEELPVSDKYSCGACKSGCEDGCRLKGESPNGHEPASLIAQQKAPEGDGIVLCRECGKPTMHMGTLCFHCSKSDSAAPDGGDVELMARQWREVADEMERWANLHQREDDHSSPIQLNPESLRTWATRIRIAALRQPAQAAPTIEDAIQSLVTALQAGKGWMRDYADSIVRDAIDRRQPAQTGAAVTPIKQPIIHGWHWHWDGEVWQMLHVWERPGHNYLAVQEDHADGKRHFRMTSKIGGDWYGPISPPDLTTSPQAAPVPVEGEGQMTEVVGFRHRMKGHSEGYEVGDWHYNFHRSPDSFELRECEIQPVWSGSTTPPPEQPVAILSAEVINTLPEEVRRYITWLETDADPAGTIQQNWRLTQENKALRVLVAVQPAVELEDFRESVECWKAVCTTQARNLPFDLTVHRSIGCVEKADRLLALIDGAKAGKGESK
jgi:hypothetical protein